MKKTIACICIIFGVLGVRATVLTNYVYVVSNIFNNVFTESVITQKVKSSHTNYYYTNYVSVVTNVYQTTYRTNVSMNVDVSQKYVYAAANAASNALSYANQLAAAATDADSSASYADSAMNRAEMYAAMASSAASDGLQRINDRIDWFDQHSGETITQNNYYWTTNVYNAADTSARARIGTNEDQIANLDNLVSLAQERIGTNENKIANFENELSLMFEGLSNWVERTFVKIVKPPKEYYYKLYVDGNYIGGSREVGTLMVDVANYEMTTVQSSTTYFYEHATSWVPDGTEAKPIVSNLRKEIPNNSPAKITIGLTASSSFGYSTFTSYDTGPDQYSFLTNDVSWVAGNGVTYRLQFLRIEY